MYEGYFLEIEKYLIAAKFEAYLMEKYTLGGEREEIVDNLDRARIALRDLIEYVNSEEG